MRVLFITFFVVFADQLTKLFIKGFSIQFLGLHHQGMELNSTIIIIDDFLRFTFVENPGMVFGIDLGGRTFFLIFRIAISIGLIYYLFKIKDKRLLLRVPLAMILGGAIGNIIDRIFYGVLYNEAPLFHGNVVDFIYVKFFKIDFFGFYLTRWPVFNVSDVAITIGVLLLMVFHKKINENNNKFEHILNVPTPDIQITKDEQANQ